MSSPKLIAYKAIAEMTAMMAEFMRNPEAIRLYGEEAAKAVAMSDVEIKKREEATKIITNSIAEWQKLQNAKDEFNKDSQVKMERIAQREYELDAKDSEIQNIKNQVEERHQEALRIKATAEAKTIEVHSMLSDVMKREEAHKKSLDDFAVEQQKLNDAKAAVSQRETDVAAREDKIKQAFA